MLREEDIRKGTDRYVKLSNGKTVLMQYASDSLLDQIPFKLINRFEAMVVSGRDNNENDLYDAFISCPAVDGNGERTAAALYADEVVLALTALGYKVFYPPIDLGNTEDVLYAYIKAMNRSQMILFIGTEKADFEEGIILHDLERLFTLRDNGMEIRRACIVANWHENEPPSLFTNAVLLNAGSHDFMFRLTAEIRCQQESLPATVEEWIAGYQPPCWDRDDHWFAERLKRIEEVIDPVDLEELDSQDFRAVDDLKPELEDDYTLYEKAINTIRKYMVGNEAPKETISDLEWAAGKILIRKLNVKGPFADNLKRLDRMGMLRTFLKERTEVTTNVANCEREIQDARKGINENSGLFRRGKRSKYEESLTYWQKRLSESQKKLDEFTKKYGDLRQDPTEARHELGRLSYETGQYYYDKKQYDLAWEHFRESLNRNPDRETNERVKKMLANDPGFAKHRKDEEEKYWPEYG